MPTDEAYAEAAKFLKEMDWPLNKDKPEADTPGTRTLAIAMLLDETFALGAEAAAQRMGGMVGSAENIMLTMRLPDHVKEHIRRVTRTLKSKVMKRAARVCREQADAFMAGAPSSRFICTALADRLDKEAEEVDGWI